MVNHMAFWLNWFCSTRIFWGKACLWFYRLNHHWTIFFRFRNEIVAMFNLSIFAQVIASVFIICLTALRLIGESHDPYAMVCSLMYLVVTIYQILLFCYVGNDIAYSVGPLVWQKCCGTDDKYHFSFRRTNSTNVPCLATTHASTRRRRRFSSFSWPSSAIVWRFHFTKWLFSSLFFRMKQPTEIKVGFIFKFTLSLSTFLWVSTNILYVSDCVIIIVFCRS